MSENRRGRRPVTGYVVRLCRDFLDQLRAHVLKGVFEFDLARNGDAVVGNGRRTKLLTQHDVATLGSKGHLHRVGQFVDTGFEAASCVLVKLQ